MSTTLTRELRFEPLSLTLPPDAPIPATIATDAPVRRYDVNEILDCSNSGVDLSRAPLPLIVSHDKNQLSIGLVENIKSEGNRVVGVVRFGTSPEAQQIRTDVIAGIHRGLSVGYTQTDNGTPVAGGFKYKWKPHEVSIVSVPADPSAGFFRSHQEINTTMKLNQMNHTELKDMCKTYRATELEDELIRSQSTEDEVRTAILNSRAARDEASFGHRNVNIESNAYDGKELIVNTLVQRMGGKPKGDVIRSTDCTGLAMRSLEMAGVRVSHFDSRDDILNRAMTTGDFPNLLGNAAGRVLLGAYDEATAPMKQVAQLVMLPNFKARTTIRMTSGTPSLEIVNENGEFKYGAMDEASNGWKLTTYGRIVKLSRQALINDDLGAFSGLLADFARSASRREADELAAMLVNSPVVDGTALFHADRSSLITGAGSALQLSSLALAVQSLRKQKEVGGGFIIQEPAYLIVPVSLETTALQLVTAITPATVGNVQPYRLTVIVEPRLDSSSSTAWYLVAGNQKSLEYGYLDGAQGPQIFQEEGFEIDGLAVKCRLDFGTGWVSPIGWVKSNGA
jgi:phage head maturation protease